jgi:hypothetical protein
MTGIREKEEIRDTMPVRDRMRALLAEIDYDFSRFSMEGFTAWLEARRGRKILFVPRPLPPTLFGAWMAGDDCDYIFYEANTLPIHQAHIQLHEMAHMLCGHPALMISSQQARILLRQAHPNPSLYESLLLRSVRPDEMELEAETLTALIQEQVLRHSTLEKLTTVLSSDEDIAEYMRAMELA